MLADYHVHTEFSDDSVYPLEAVVRDAIGLGLDEICITDHVDYGVKDDPDSGKEVRYRRGEPLDSQIAFVENLFLAAMTIGLSMFASQYWGKGDLDAVETVLAYAMRTTLAVSAVFTLAGFCAPAFLMGLFTDDPVLTGLGAGYLKTAKEYGGRLCKLSILCGVGSGLALLALTPWIFRLTDLSPQAGAYLKGMLVMCSCYLVGKSVNCTTISGIFCAGGDSKFGFLCDTIVMWCVTVPLGFLTAFVFRLPVLAVYFAVNMDEIIKLPAVYRHYKKYLWVKNLTVKENKT